MRITDVMKANKALGITAHATGTIPELMAIKDSTPANVLGIATDTTAFVTYDGIGGAKISYGNGQPYAAGFSIGLNTYGQADIADYSASLGYTNGNYSLPVGTAGVVPLLRGPNHDTTARDLTLVGGVGNIVAPPILSDRPAYRAANVNYTVTITLIDKTLAANGLTAGQFLYLLLVLQETDTGDWYAPHLNASGNRIIMQSDGTLMQPFQSKLQFSTGPTNTYLSLSRRFDEMFFFCYVTESGKSVPLGQNYMTSTLLEFNIDIT